MAEKVLFSTLPGKFTKKTLARVYVMVVGGRDPGLGTHSSEGGLSAGAGIGDDFWPGSRHNEQSSLARMASGGGIYAGSEELNFND